MSEQTCPRCDRGHIGDRYVCLDCAQEAVKDLTEAAEFLTWIDDKRARRGSVKIGSGSRSAEHPLPYDPRVRYVLGPIRNALTTWARLVIEEHQCRDLPADTDTARVQRLEAELAAWDKVAAVDLTGDDRRYVEAFRRTVAEDLERARQRADLDQLAQVARWLADHAEWITGKEWAHDLFNDAQAAHKNLARLFDNQPDTYALGPCDHDGCTNLMAATVGEMTHTCARCGWEHDVQQRRLDLLNQADAMNVTVREGVRLMKLIGHNVDDRTIWAAIKHFGIPSPWKRTIPGVKHPVSVYPLGLIREAVEQMAEDDDTRKAVARVKRGDRETVPARMSAS